MVKNPPAHTGDIRYEVQSQGWEDPLEESLYTLLCLCLLNLIPLYISTYLLFRLFTYLCYFRVLSGVEFSVIYSRSLFIPILLKYVYITVYMACHIMPY